MGAADSKEQRIVGRPFPKGVSGNPRGKPRSTLGELIRRQSDDGQELVAFAFAVLRGQLAFLDERGHPVLGPDGNPSLALEQASVKERLMALHWLAERGWGKPDSISPTQQARHDLTKLQGHELDSLLSLVDKTAVREPVTVEADAVEVAKDATPEGER